ncbi:S41 family peptidase [Rhodohalobacter sp. 8-1]|uniref:S41 family peptidase n=1 Tax=Rhodohalobacter sp. 8-1 TaxID=3131972 RepID=UPI0030EEE8D7
MLPISKRYTTIILLILLLAGSLAFTQANDLFFQIKKQLTIFSDAYKEVATLYVEDVSPERLMTTGLNAMLKELDPYTVFIPEGEQQQMEIISTGSYGGVGIDAGYRGDDIVVIAPLEGYPADRAGIRPGDIILRINDVLVAGISPEEVQQLTIGDPGTEITLTIRRAGMDELLEFKLEREQIVVKNIEYAGRLESNQNVGYIKLTRFGQRSAEEIREKLLEFESNGVNSLILDLRNNPGGLLNEAVEIVDKFIEPGVTVVETKGRIENENSTFVSDEPPVFEDLPIIVLMNEGSASASEVVAGAFQDLDRAVILGETSFGKGLVQTVRPLSYNTSLKITISQYFTPSGRSIQSVDYTGGNGSDGRQIPDSLRRAFTTKNGRTVYDGFGIEPDVKVSEDKLTRLQLALLQNNNFFFFVADYIARNGNERPENMYERFLTYLEVENFDYETPAERNIKQLMANGDIFYNEQQSNELLSQLQESVNRKKEQLLEENKGFIEKKLREEWVTQSGTTDEKVQYNLQQDVMIQEAIQLFGNRNSYDVILKP